jgi:ABC-type sugar transport system ATPase subunit
MFDKVLIANEPTRGVDVAAKHEIYRFINSLTLSCPCRTYSLAHSSFNE